MPIKATYDVFISYSRADAAHAAALNHRLTNDGLVIFFDRDDLRPGDFWIGDLEAAIAASKAIVILVGERGLGNTQQHERALAFVRKTRSPDFPVIPVILPCNRTPPTGFLELVTWIDLGDAPSTDSEAAEAPLQALIKAARGGSVAASRLRARTCPYRGLEAFREEDVPFYFGRAKAAAELRAKVEAHDFLAVVGRSGSGKSSLVFAGLLPLLRRQSIERRGAVWDVVSLTPGRKPLHELGRAFNPPLAAQSGDDVVACLEERAANYRNSTDDGFLRDAIMERLQETEDRDPCGKRPVRANTRMPAWPHAFRIAPTLSNDSLRSQCRRGRKAGFRSLARELGPSTLRTCVHEPAEGPLSIRVAAPGARS